MNRTDIITAQGAVKSEMFYRNVRIFSPPNEIDNLDFR